MPKYELLWCGKESVLIDGYMFEGQSNIDRALSIEGQITPDQWAEIMAVEGE